MASTPSRKRTRSRPAPRPRRVADLTADELRTMIEQLIEHELAKFAPLPTRSVESVVTAQMRQRVASAAGRFHSGFSDISVKHGDYIEFPSSKDYLPIPK